MPWFFLLTGIGYGLAGIAHQATQHEDDWENQVIGRVGYMFVAAGTSLLILTTAFNASGSPATITLHTSIGKDRTINVPEVRVSPGLPTLALRTLSFLSVCVFLGVAITYNLMLTGVWSVLATLLSIVVSLRESLKSEAPGQRYLRAKAAGK